MRALRQCATPSFSYFLQALVFHKGKAKVFHRLVKKSVKKRLNGFSIPFFRHLRSVLNGFACGKLCGTVKIIVNKTICYQTVFQASAAGAIHGASQFTPVRAIHFFFLEYQITTPTTATATGSNSTKIIPQTANCVTETASAVLSIAAEAMVMPSSPIPLIALSAL